MKCPICNAPTEVRDTRMTKTGHEVRRKRVCFNEHVLRTRETLEKAEEPRNLAALFKPKKG